MSADEQQLDLLCNEVHIIMMHATENLSVPDPKLARDIRKKISVFTYGIVSELAGQFKVDVDLAYEKYLMLGGLNTGQAKIIVKRTRDEFLLREYGEDCVLTGRRVVRQWNSGNKNIQALIEALL